MKHVFNNVTYTIIVFLLAGSLSAMKRSCSESSLSFVNCNSNSLADSMLTLPGTGSGILNLAVNYELHKYKVEFRAFRLFSAKRALVRFAIVKGTKAENQRLKDTVQKQQQKIVELQQIATLSQENNALNARLLPSDGSDTKHVDKNATRKMYALCDTKTSIVRRKSRVGDFDN